MRSASQPYVHAPTHEYFKEDPRFSSRGGARTHYLDIPSDDESLAENPWVLVAPLDPTTDVDAEACTYSQMPYENQYGTLRAGRYFPLTYNTQSQEEWCNAGSQSSGPFRRIPWPPMGGIDIEVLRQMVTVTWKDAGRAGGRAVISVANLLTSIHTYCRGKWPADEDNAPQKSSDVVHAWDVTFNGESHRLCITGYLMMLARDVRLLVFLYPRHAPNTVRMLK